jgi:hypothetical protein
MSFLACSIGRLEKRLAKASVYAQVSYISSLPITGSGLASSILSGQGGEAAQGGNFSHSAPLVDVAIQNRHATAIPENLVFI